MSNKPLIAAKVRKSAELSECGNYRWWLRRDWTFTSLQSGDVRGRGVCCFVMLNPSTADADIDDPTIRRCISFAQRWGFTTLSVRNLFPYRATDPRELTRHSKCLMCGGDRGDSELLAALTADLVVAAWGIHGSLWSRDQDVNELWLEKFSGVPIWCLGRTKKGHPKHPLYVPSNAVLERFN